MKERWSSKLDGEIYKLGVAEDWIVVGQLNGVTAIDTKSGKTLWKIGLSLDADSLLLISDDVLVAASASQLFVINKAGEKLHTIDLQPKQSTEVVGMYAGYIFVYRRADGALEVYSIQNEALAWEITTHRGGVSVNFDPKTNIAFITSSGFVSANDITDGTEIWKVKTVARTGVLDSNVLFYHWEIESEKMGHISAVDTSNSARLWDISTPYAIQDNVFNLAILDNKLIVTTNLGVSAIDKKDGNELWQFRSTDFVYGNPVLINNILYTRGVTTSIIHAISIEDGSSLGRLNLGDPALFSFSQPDYDLVYKSGEFLIFPFEDTVYAYHE
jgi:outer membrane protein assembly factor BamB